MDSGTKQSDMYHENLYSVYCKVRCWEQVKFECEVTIGKNTFVLLLREYLQKHFYTRSFPRMSSDRPDTCTCITIFNFTRKTDKTFK